MEEEIEVEEKDEEE